MGRRRRKTVDVIFSSSTWPGISASSLRGEGGEPCMCGYLLPLGTPRRLLPSSTSSEISRNPSNRRDADPRALDHCQNLRACFSRQRRRTYISLSLPLCAPFPSFSLARYRGRWWCTPSLREPCLPWIKGESRDDRSLTGAKYF